MSNDKRALYRNHVEPTPTIETIYPEGGDRRRPKRGSTAPNNPRSVEFDDPEAAATVDPNAFVHVVPVDQRNSLAYYSATGSNRVGGDGLSQVSGSFSQREKVGGGASVASTASFPPEMQLVHEGATMSAKDYSDALDFSEFAPGPSKQTYRLSNEVRSQLVQRTLRRESERSQRSTGSSLVLRSSTDNDIGRDGLYPVYKEAEEPPNYNMTPDVKGRLSGRESKKP